jgi:exopolyphosphatase/guanosine-5'-triphosphate,3'-diphosphate pyrophosphatase
VTADAGRASRLATVDLGTNTVRLLVVEAAGGRWRTLHQTQRVTRLGEGQAAAGRLLPEPMRRTAAAVTEFAQAARRLGATRLRIVATSAVREAANRAEFVAALEAQAGEPVEVVSGEEEARLALQGVASGLPDLGESFVLFDIGGGSTEFVRARAGHAAAAVSLRLGVVPLAEAWSEPGPVRWDRFAQMRAGIERQLAAEVPPAIAAAGAGELVGTLELVGTGGTVTTLAALDLGLAAYDADRVNGHRLTRAAVERALARLGALPVADRGRLPCLEPGRADLIIPGIAICLAALARFGREQLVVSDRGLREGLLCELLERAS